MNDTILIIFYLILAVVLISMLLPNLLRALGLHPRYKGNAYDLSGKKALIITTSHGVFDHNGKKTGVFASEMTAPYYEFIDGNMTVDLASIKGGVIPIEPISLKYPIASDSDKRFLKDKKFQRKVKDSLIIDNIDFTTYDIIFMSGGWGAAYDLGKSKILGDKITQANEKGIILGAVCHGVLGFLMAKDVDDQPLVEGKKMTGVTDKQVKELRITKTPMHPETELRKAGANYQSAEAFMDTFATLTITDGNMVTGQNQNSGKETAQAMMKLLEERDKDANRA